LNAMQLRAVELGAIDVTD